MGTMQCTKHPPSTPNGCIPMQGERLAGDGHAA